MIWFLLVFAFLIIEAMTLNLVTIWFAFGSLCSFISTYFTDNIIIQLIIFIVATTISLIFTKPILKKYLMVGNEKTNFDRIIGKVGVVTKEIELHDNGRVKIDGKSWMATSSENIKVGKEVEILKIDGAKLIVKERKR